MLRKSVFPNTNDVTELLYYSMGYRHHDEMTNENYKQ